MSDRGETRRHHKSIRQEEVKRRLVEQRLDTNYIKPTNFLKESNFKPSRSRDTIQEVPLKDPINAIIKGNRKPLIFIILKQKTFKSSTTLDIFELMMRDFVSFLFTIYLRFPSLLRGVYDSKTFYKSNYQQETNTKTFSHNHQL